MDIDDLQAAIQIATEEALELGGEMALRIVGGGPFDEMTTTQLAIDFDRKRREIRRLRRALKAEVAG